MTIQESPFIVIKRVIARELGNLIAAREVGFQVSDVLIRRSLDGLSFDVCRSALGLLDAAKNHGPMSYIEKRLFVLCSGGFAESIVVRDEKKKALEQLDGDEFWQCFQNDYWAVRPGRASVSDYKKACEITAVYRSLLYSEGTPSEQHLSDEFHSQEIHRYMHTLGQLPLCGLLTEDTFLNLVDSIAAREISDDGSLRNQSITLGISDIATYASGNRDAIASVHQVYDVTSDGCASSPARFPPKNDLRETHRIFAHELGHWMAAEIVGIKKSGVEFRWERWRGQHEACGFCTVFVGSACITLGFQRYLASRIATMVAGPLADCCMRFPGEEGIGEELYGTLYRGHGADDFEKAIELIIIYCAEHLAPRGHRSIEADREVGKAHVLEAVVGIFRKFGIFEVIRSDLYLSFISKFIDKKQNEINEKSLFADQIKLTISSAEISDYLATDEGMSKLVHEAKKHAGEL
jgi:hypothetical protein